MKTPSAPNLYPDLSTEGTSIEDNGQNYRLQKLSEIEKTLINERDMRKSLYKKYKRGINITDGVDTCLISASVITAGVGFAAPIMLPLEIAAVVCGSLGVCVKLVRRRLHAKAQKHYEIKTMAETKLNTIKDLISKALQDGQISEIEFKMVLNEMEKYSKLKQEIKESKNSEISEAEKKQVNRTRAKGSNERSTKKFKTYVICFANIYEYEKPPAYSE